jgi:hypothetical protein
MPRRQIRTVVIGAMLLVAAFGCDGESHDAADRDDESTADAFERDAELARHASVRVEAWGCGLRPHIGGGGFVSDDLILTVAHVVAGAKEIKVHLSDETTVNAALVAIDRVRDLAVLSASAPQITPVATGSMTVGAVGAYLVLRDDVAVVQQSRTASFVDLDVAGIDDATTSLRRGYQLAAEVHRGDSGSLIISGGKATAVIFATSTAAQGRAWATDITEAERLLEPAPTEPVSTGKCD